MDSIAEMRRKLGANPLGLHAAKHRVHTIGSRSPEKLHFLAYAMWDRMEKNIANGVIQMVTPTYGFIRIGSKQPHYDPFDFRASWKSRWEAPLNDNQKEALDAIKTIFNERPSALAFDRNGAVDVESIISYMDKILHVDINRYGLDKIVFSLKPRLFTYQNHKRSIRLIRKNDICLITEEEANIPPQFLYHATSIEHVRDIDCEGIQPIESPLVSLAENPNEAKSYLSKGTAFFIYRVNATDMVRSGWQFAKTSAGEWKTPVVPLQFLTYG